jgi:putative spermidine/putrescine transport system ATP-binding protein
MAEVELRNVSKFYKDVAAVNDVSLRIADREFIALLGPSGCGKTTTLRMLAGFIRPDAGRIFIDGKDVTDTPPERRPTGMVFQSYALWPHMTVADNIAFGLRLRRMPRAEIAQRTQAMLDVVRLPGVEARYPSQLSGGQQQRVALARALVLGPKILLLDEPLSNLDAKLRVRMRDEIRRIQQELQITTVYVTHDQEEALTMADRIAVMNRGLIQQLGDANDIYDRPATSFVADFIGQSNFFHGTLRRSNGMTWAQVGETRVAVEPVDGVADGAPVTISARPEDVELVRAPEPGAIALDDARLVNFGAYQRLVGRHAGVGTIEARVPKSFRLDGHPLYAKLTRARAFAEVAGEPRD